MIIIFRTTQKELIRIEASKPPEEGDNVRLPEVADTEFVVEKVVYEYFGSNDRHIAEITVK